MASAATPSSFQSRFFLGLMSCGLLLLWAAAPMQAQDVETIKLPPPCILVGQPDGTMRSVSFHQVPAATQQRLLEPHAHHTGEIGRTSEAASRGATERQQATIVISYGPGFDGQDEARAAFRRAADTWERHLDSSVEITVSADFEPLGGRTLGSAGPDLFYSRPYQNTGETYFYADALYDALIGSDEDRSGTEAEIVANFNSDINWYYGEDPSGASPGQFDFTTVVLHELGHGLGFVGSMEVDGNMEGSYNTTPLIYDRFAEDVMDASLLNTAVYPNPSTELGNVLTDQDADTDESSVRFDGQNAREGVLANRSTADPRAKLFTPDSWNPGSSYSHLDEDEYPGAQGDADALMTPQFGQQEAAREPGPIVCGMFADMEWPLASGCLSAIPVELAGDFGGVVNDGDVVLTWTTLSERNNARFRILQKRGASFAEVGTEPTRAPGGTSGEAHAYRHRVENIAPGRHVFRLVQVDHDDTERFGAETTVEVGVEGAFHLSQVHPNPVRDRAELTLAVGTGQHVSAVLFDARARRVRTLYEGSLSEGRVERLTVEAGALASGTYLVRVTGETFAATRTVTLVR